MFTPNKTGVVNLSEASFAEQKLQIPNNPFKLQLKNQKQGQNVIGYSFAQILFKFTQHFFWYNPANK